MGFCFQRRELCAQELGHGAGFAVVATAAAAVGAVPARLCRGTGLAGLGGEFLPELLRFFGLFAGELFFLKLEGLALGFGCGEERFLLVELLLRGEGVAFEFLAVEGWGVGFGLGGGMGFLEAICVAWRGEAVGLVPVDFHEAVVEDDFRTVVRALCGCPVGILDQCQALVGLHCDLFYLAKVAEEVPDGVFVEFLFGYLFHHNCCD